MRPLVALALAALLTASLAGCADDKERYPDGVPTTSTTSTGTQGSGSTGSATATSSSTTTSGPGGAENQAPTGSITVAINGTNATFTLTGADPDDDPIVWDLDFGDGNATNGTSLPQTVNHTYAGGTFRANFTITDGTAPATFSADVGIVGSGGDPNAGLPAPIVFTGEAANYGELGCGGFPNPLLDTVYHDFDSALSGTWKFKTDPAEMVTEWWEGDAAFTSGTGEGTIPAGSDNVIACPAGPVAPAAEYTLTLYHPDYVLPAPPA